MITPQVDAILARYSAELQAMDRRSARQHIVAVGLFVATLMVYIGWTALLLRGG
jgi:hypothetical protein